MASQGEVGYPSDVSDEEWAFVLPDLLLSREDSAHREHDLRAVFNGVRYIARTGNQWRLMTRCTTILRGQRFISKCSAGCERDVLSGWLKHVHFAARVCRTQGPADGSVHRQPHAAIHSRERRAGAQRTWRERRKGSKVHIAVDTLAHLSALSVTPADQGDRAQVETLAQDIQQVTGETVERRTSIRATPARIVP